MMDAMTRADLYGKESTKYFNLAKSAHLLSFATTTAASLSGTSRLTTNCDRRKNKMPASAVGSIRDTKQSEAGVEFRLGRR
jgi:hypothetical protein